MTQFNYGGRKLCFSEHHGQAKFRRERAVTRASLFCFTSGPVVVCPSPSHRSCSFGVFFLWIACGLTRARPNVFVFFRAGPALTFTTYTLYRHQAVHTPGHSMGSITLLYSGGEEGVAFTGDHLALSGRTGALTGFPRCEDVARLQLTFLSLQPPESGFRL